jgi:hypothetical protein
MIAPIMADVKPLGVGGPQQGLGIVGWREDEGNVAVDHPSAAIWIRQINRP